MVAHINYLTNDLHRNSPLIPSKCVLNIDNLDTRHTSKDHNSATHLPQPNHANSKIWNNSMCVDARSLSDYGHADIISTIFHPIIHNKPSIAILTKVTVSMSRHVNSVNSIALKHRSPVHVTVFVAGTHTSEMASETFIKRNYTAYWLWSWK